MNRPLCNLNTACAWLQRLPLPLLELALVVGWSSGFVGARFSIDYAPAELVVFWRCVTVTLVLLPFVAKRLLRASPGALLHNAGIGFLAMASYLAGVTQGIALGVPAGLAALLADLLPLGMALLSALLGQRLCAATWRGLLIGLGGMLIVAHDAMRLGRAPLWVYGLPLLGMLALAVATLWRNRWPQAQSLDLLSNLWLQCAVAAVCFGAFAGLRGGLAPIASAGFAWSVGWTASIATLGGYGLYWVCLRRSNPVRVASVLYLSPALTYLWAWVAFAEPLSWSMLGGSLVCLLGVWQVMRADASQPGHRQELSDEGGRVSR